MDFVKGLVVGSIFGIASTVLFYEYKKKKDEEFNKELEVIENDYNKLVDKFNKVEEKHIIEEQDFEDSYYHSKDIKKINAFDEYKKHKEEISQKIEKECEGRVLKHDINSDAALEQYFSILLSNLPSISTRYRDLLLSASNYVFKPITDVDRITHENLISKRLEFFGNMSRHVRDITLMEILIYFAERAEFELDYNATDTVCKFINNILELNSYGELDYSFELILNHEASFFGPEYDLEGFEHQFQEWLTDRLEMIK